MVPTFPGRGYEWWTIADSSPHRAYLECERFIKTLKQEEIYCSEYRDMDDLRANLSVFLDRYYNATRLHSALGYLSPDEFEKRAQSAKAEIAPAPRMSFLRHEEI